MKPIIDWVLARRERLVILAVAPASLLPWFSAALLTLETAYRGTRPGLVSAVIGMAALVALGLVTGGSFVLLAVIGAVSFLPGVLIGALLRRAGGLLFAFQSTAAIALATLLGLWAVGLTPERLLGPAVDEVLTLFRTMEAAGEVAPLTAEQMAALRARLASLLLVSVLFSQLLLPLLLGYWWLTLAVGERRFGEEFRALRLGRLVGGLATLAVLLGLVIEAPVVQDLALLALLTFLLQGLAVLHAWAHARQWHVALLVPVYVMLVVPPLTVFAVPVLGLVGLVDNWLSLRAPLRTRA